MESILEVDENYLQNDPLKLIRIMYIELFRNKFIRFVLYLLVFYFVVLILVQTYLFVHFWDLLYFTQYGPFYFCTYYMIVSTLSAILNPEVINQAMGMLDFLKIKSDYGETYKRIQFEARVVRIGTLVLIISSVICSILFIIPDPGDEQMFFSYNIFKTYLPEWYQPLVIFYRITFFLMAFVMPAGCFHIIYATFLGRFQIYILKYYIENLLFTDDPTRKESEIFYNDDFQAIINRRLIFTCINHNKLMKSGNCGKTYLRILLPFLCVSATIMAISVLFFYNSFRDFSVFVLYFRFYTFSAVGAGTFGAVMWAGQMMEDASDSCFSTMAAIKWYNLNKQNKQIYLMILMTLSVPYKFEFSEDISINFHLAVDICKSIYSVASVAIQMRHL